MWTIGLGNAVAADELRQIAGAGGGKYLAVAAPSDLLLRTTSFDPQTFSKLPVQPVGQSLFTQGRAPRPKPAQRH